MFHISITKVFATKVLLKLRHISPTTNLAHRSGHNGRRHTDSSPRSDHKTRCGDRHSPEGSWVHIGQRGKPGCSLAPSIQGHTDTRQSLQHSHDKKNTGAMVRLKEHKRINRKPDKSNSIIIILVG